MSNKVVAVTGASQGIGKAIAEVFTESGASVILLSRNEDKLKAINVKYFVLDVSKSEQVEKVFKEIGDVDILINNAGIFFSSPVQEINIKKWKELLEINLNGTMYCSRAVIPNMVKKKSGRIINISSTCGKTGEAYSSAYSASKFGLIGFTQSFALEVAKDNITVNAICPGWTKTQMADEIVHDEKYANLIGIPIDKLEEYSIEAVPIGRYVQPKEIGYLSLYLASDYASAITGQSINICGGICMN